MSAFRRLASAASILLLAAAANAPEGVELRWRFKAGDVLRYRMVMKQEMQMSGPAEFETTTDMAFAMREEVKEVSPAGVAKIDVKYEALRAEMAMPMGDLSYDSTRKGEDAKKNSEELSALAGLLDMQFHMEMDPTGRVLSVSGLKEAVEKAFADQGDDPMSKQMLSGLRKAFDEDRVREMFEFNVFPEKKLAAGDTWNRAFEIPAPMIGKMKYALDFKFDGTEDRAGAPIAKLSYVAKLTIEKGAADEAPVSDQFDMDIAMDSSDGKGTVLFDMRAGRVLENNLTMKMDLTMTLRPTGDGNGQSMEMAMEMAMDMTVRLLGADEPPF